MRSTIKIVKRQKGQAAIEFLVTYGWAILGAMIAIGALSYFGIFNTQKYVSDTCYFGDQITCEDYIAFNNGSVSVNLRNNFGVNLDINTTIIKSDYGTVTCFNATSTPIVPAYASIAPGSTFSITCNLTGNTVPTNSKLKYKATIMFQRSGSSNVHNQTGDVSVTVQKKP
jgi:hypothetical protein